MQTALSASLFLSLSVYLCVSISITLYIALCFFVSLCFSPYIYVPLYLSLFLSLSASVSLSLCISCYLSVSVSLSIFVSPSLCLSLSLASVLNSSPKIHMSQSGRGKTHLFSSFQMTNGNEPHWGRRRWWGEGADTTGGIGLTQWSLNHELKLGSTPCFCVSWGHGDAWGVICKVLPYTVQEPENSTGASHKTLFLRVFLKNCFWKQATVDGQILSYATW